MRSDKPKNRHADAAPVRALRPAFAIALAMSLAGCTWLGGGGPNASGADDPDPSTGPDTASYTDGPGFAIVVHNHAEDRFDMAVLVLGGNAEIGRLSNHLVPGETAEKWISLSQPGNFTARLNYTWSRPGSSSQGLDDQAFDSSACPVVTRLEWDLRQSGNTVGHLFLGKTCVTA